MAINNSLTTQNNKATFSAFLTKDAVKNQINSIVGGKDGQRFISAIISAVSVNPALKECENSTILSAALLGESLKLSPSPHLGHYYMVPFNNKGGKVATFQLGYKGYLQLAIRSGQYKKINVMAIKDGELKYFDPLNEEIELELMVDDWDAREQSKTIGYYATFELVNGFKKSIYWSKNQMINHADKYSPAFNKETFAKLEAGEIPQEDTWKYTFWYKNFDGMAYKTMLRQLISKWGIMSTEMAQAFTSDMGVIKEDGAVEYVENDAENIEAPATEEHITEEAPVQPEPEKKKSSGIAGALFG